MTATEKRIQRIARLKARLQKEKTLLGISERKARNGRLVIFGVYLEKVFKAADSAGRERIETSMREHLTGRNLERALDGLTHLRKEVRPNTLTELNAETIDAINEPIEGREGANSVEEFAKAMKRNG